MNKYSSTQRREIIARIVANEDVRSQEELQKLLRKEGVEVAQPTLSRDVAELGLVKSASGYSLPGDGEDDTTPQERREERLAQAVRGFAIEVKKAATMVVVKTTVAAAQPVARAIDEASWPEVIGTLGGDDTIFLATESSSAADRVIRRLTAMMNPRTTRRPRA